MTLYGVDVSYHQGAIDWPKVAADGMTFSVARASIGTQPDIEYVAKTAGAKRAGLIVGAYHYLYADTLVDVAAQCDAFLRATGPLDGMIAMLDIERPENDAPREADIRAWVRRFRETYPTHPLLLYAPAWRWPALGNPNVAGLGPLWASHYVSVPDAGAAYPWRQLAARVPASFWTARHGGWSRATILQFTSSGKVNGYPHRLDVNAFEGDRSDLLALTRNEEVSAMRLQDVKPAMGRATLTKPWALWTVATDRQTAERPVGTAYEYVASCTYHHGEDRPGGYPGLLVWVGPDRELAVLPSGVEVALTIAPTPVPASVILATRQAEWERVKAGTTAAATLPPKPSA